LRSMFTVGVDGWGPAPEVDMAAHNQVALETARQGIVLLKNDGALPLATGRPLTIAVIGGHAQEGVPSGTGSGAGLPGGGGAGRLKNRGPRRPGRGPDRVPGPLAAVRRVGKAAAAGTARVRPGSHPG